MPTTSLLIAILLIHPLPTARSLIRTIVKSAHPIFLSPTHLGSSPITIRYPPSSIKALLIYSFLQMIMILHQAALSIAIVN
jgi:hypothetical protein